MQANRGKNSSPERVMRMRLAASAIRGFKMNMTGIPGRPDISFPKKKIAVFINGCFWHRCPYCKPSLPRRNRQFWKSKFEMNVTRDRKVRRRLSRIGWRTLVIWECQIEKNSLKCARKIESKLTS
jgi:DNA mismatch endonuclease (patch repair protein)